jgi:hypothetical protein
MLILYPLLIFHIIPYNIKLLCDIQHLNYLYRLARRVMENPLCIRSLDKTGPGPHAHHSNDECALLKRTTNCASLWGESGDEALITRKII